MTKKKSWVAQDYNEPHLYWSNEFGFVPLAQADRWTEDATRKLNLPLGARWVQVTPELKLRSHLVDRHEFEPDDPILERSAEGLGALHLDLHLHDDIAEVRS